MGNVKRMIKKINITSLKNLKKPDSVKIITLEAALNSIKNGVPESVKDSSGKKAVVSLLNDIKAEINEKKRRQMKQRLPSFLFQGEFKIATNEGLKNHSMLVVLDYDQYKDLPEEYRGMLDDHFIRKTFIDDPHVVAVFTSPSGQGLKILVYVKLYTGQIQDNQTHKKVYRGVINYFEPKLELVSFDDTSDLARRCFYSYDPYIYINYNADPLYAEEYENTKKLNFDSIEDGCNAALEKTEEKHTFGKGNRQLFAVVFSTWAIKYGIHESGAILFFSKYLDRIDPDLTADHDNQYYIDAIKRGYKTYGTSFGKYAGTTKRVNVGYWIELWNKKGSKIVDFELTAASVFNFIQTQGHNVLLEKGILPVNPMIIQIKNKIAMPVTRDHVLNKLKNDEYIKPDYDNNLLEKLNSKRIKSLPQLFSRDKISMLPSVEINQFNGSKHIAYLPFKNGIVVIRPDDVRIVSYHQFENNIWDTDINNFNIELDKNTDNKANDLYKKFGHEKLSTMYTKGDFATFSIRLATNNGGEIDPIRLHALLCTQAYLAHTWNNPHSPQIPIITETNPNISSRDGGTGKSLNCVAIRHLRPGTVVINGDELKRGISRFLWQQVQRSTRFIYFDDVVTGSSLLDFLYSASTSGLSVEQKNKTAFTFPFEDTPRIAITSNYPLIKAGFSYDRRFYQMEIYSFYGRNRQPIQDMKNGLLFGWSKDHKEWQYFFNYFIKVLQTLLIHYQDHNTLPVYTSESLKKKHLISQLFMPSQEIALDLIEFFRERKYAEDGTRFDLDEELGLWNKNRVDKDGRPSKDEGFIERSHFKRKLKVYAQLKGKKVTSKQRQAPETTGRDFWFK